MVNNFGLDKMFGRLAPGMCRLSMSGAIAVKTSGGYKSYNVKQNRLTNCSNFVFDIGDDFFFLIPTNKVDVGDIIIVNGSPRCVVKADKNSITAINYENSVVETILPERHVFMGNTYFYGKIVSMFGSGANVKSAKGNMIKYYMMSQMFKGGSDSFGSGNPMGMMFMMNMMNGGSNDSDNMFSGLFDEDIFSPFNNTEDEDDEPVEEDNE